MNRNKLKELAKKLDFGDLAVIVAHIYLSETRAEMRKAVKNTRLTTDDKALLKEDLKDENTLVYNANLMMEGDYFSDNLQNDVELMITTLAHEYVHVSKGKKRRK